VNLEESCQMSFFVTSGAAQKTPDGATTSGYMKWEVGLVLGWCFCNGLQAGEALLELATDHGVAVHEEADGL
jgi:hypothetical protein